MANLMNGQDTAKCAPVKLGFASCLLMVIALCGPPVFAGHEPLPPLTTVSGSPRLNGKFVWADLVTDDVVSARRFYGDLFGWTFQNVGEYTIAANDERPLCGM